MRAAACSKGQDGTASMCTAQHPTHTLARKEFTWGAQGTHKPHIKNLMMSVVCIKNTAR